MERSEGSIILLLPEDVLAEIFRRLPPHGLAVLRCVCGAWRAFIDARRLLRVDLPHSVASFLLNFHELRASHLLSHPSAASTAADLDLTVSGKLDHVHPIPTVHVRDHCNGLVLIHDTVANPATRQTARLPLHPRLDRSFWPFFYINRYIAFDPAVSPHYEVLSVPRICYWRRRVGLDPAIEALEWPPSQWAMHIFSSRTGQWEVMSFAREGGAVGTVADMRGDSLPRKRNAVYWQNKLYVLCETNILVRISMSDRKYHIVKPPIPPVGIGYRRYPNLYLGRSESGVYCAIVNYSILQVWLLDESDCQMKWRLKHQNYGIRTMLQPQNLIGRCDTPWVLRNVHAYEDAIDKDAIYAEKIERDRESGVELEDDVICDRYSANHISTILGFHPYKEVVFLSQGVKRGLAYHFDSGKVEDIGSLYPPSYEEVTNRPYIEASFPYTPCLVRMLPETMHSEI